MTAPTEATTVRTSIVVDAPIERTFAVFTEQMITWWSPDHHLLGDVKEMVFEPRVGGNIYDRAADGTECRWARVLAYDPPTRLVFSWDINTRWELETDLDKTSEVEVRFDAESPARTRVELEHRNIDRHGDGWEGMRAAVGADDGWPAGLRSFAARIQSAA